MQMTPRVKSSLYIFLVMWFLVTAVFSLILIRYVVGDIAMDVNNTYIWALIAVTTFSTALLVHSYLFYRLARLTHRTGLKSIFAGTSIICLFVSLYRLSIIFSEPDTIFQQAIFPQTSTMAWVVITSGGAIAVHYIESAIAQTRISKATFDLTEAVFENIITPLTKGEQVPIERVEEYKTKTAHLRAA